MHAVVVGAGMVGQNLAEALYREGHNVTIVDTSRNALERASENLDIQTYQGHGADADLLAQIGVPGAEFFMAVTDVDEINLLACLVAKELGALLTVARVTSRVYLGGRRTLYRNLMGVDIAVSPENLTAMEIGRHARAAGVVAIHTLTGGRLALREVCISEQTAPVGIPVRDLELASGTLLAMVMHDGHATVPSGDDLVQAGDDVFLLGHAKEVEETSKRLGKEVGRVARAIVVGGGSIGLLAAQSLADLRVDVRLIDKDAARCRQLADSLARGEVLHGDGTDVTLLREAGIEDIDLFVASAGQDELNLILGMLATELGAKKRVVLVKRSDFQPIVDRLGMDAAISPRMMTAEAIMRYIKRRTFTPLASVGANHAMILDTVLSSNSSVVERPLHEVELPRGTLIGAIMRGDDLLIPDGAQVMKPGDNVIVFAHAEHVSTLEKAF